MNKLYGLTVAFSTLAAAVLSLDASAQTTTRDTVRAEAAASAPALGSNRQGDQTVGKPAATTESRAAKKSEAEARAMGSHRVTEQSLPSQSQGAKPRPSVESRADVKAGAAAANKPTGDKPTGEASQKGQDRGVTKP